MEQGQPPQSWLILRDLGEIKGRLKDSKIVTTRKLTHFIPIQAHATFAGYAIHLFLIHSFQTLFKLIDLPP